MKVKKETLFPKTKIQWLWENMKGRRVLYVIGMLGTVVYNILQLTVPYYSGRIVDLFLSGADAWKNMRTNSGLFYHLLILMIVFTVLRGVIVYGDCMIYEHVSQTVLYRVRNFLYDKIQRQDMTFYSTYRTGDLMTRVTGDLDAVRHMVAWVIRMVIESFSLFGVVAIYFFYMNWKMALSLLIISPFVFFIIYLFKNKVAPMHAKLREKLAQMNTYAQENISGNRVVKAFAKEDFEIEKFNKENDKFRAAQIDASKIWMKYVPIFEVLSYALTIILILYGGYMVIQGEITLGQLVTVNGYLWMLNNPLRQAGWLVNDISNFTTSVEKIYATYSEEPHVKTPVSGVVKKHLKGEIEFKNVSYRADDEDIVMDVNFKVKPGQTVGIIGSTGAGKSTIMNLLCRFYDTTSGEVLVDGVNVRDMDLYNLRDNIGMAMQDVFLFSDTIEGNIAYGRPNCSFEEVKQAAIMADANHFIQALPDGYDTIVGERGVGLSGGQKQRISIARAIAKKAPILILDDSTSALDMETEHEIQKTLNELKDTTKMIIAHRISAVCHADEIIYLKDGEIAERGTHQELLAKRGLYYETYMAQYGTFLGGEAM